MFDREERNTYEVEYGYFDSDTMRVVHGVELLDAWNIWDAAGKVAELHGEHACFYIVEIARYTGGNTWEIDYISQECPIPIKYQTAPIIWA